MQSFRSTVGVEIRRAKEIMDECVDQVMATLGGTYRGKVMKLMDKERSTMNYNIRAQGEHRVRYIKAIVHKDVFPDFAVF